MNYRIKPVQSARSKLCRKEDSVLVPGICGRNSKYNHSEIVRVECEYRSADRISDMGAQRTWHWGNKRNKMKEAGVSIYFPTTVILKYLSVHIIIK